MKTNNILSHSRNDYQLVLLPGRFPPPEYRGYYDACFETWKFIWSSTLRDLDGLNDLRSDEFTRQDTIAALFNGKVCIGLVCFRLIDGTSIVDLADSWFKPWQYETLKKVTAGCNHGLVISYFSVHPAHRRTQEQGADALDVAKVITEISTRFCLDVQCDIAFGVTRNDRSVNRLAIYGGAAVVAENQRHHGVAVDLVAFYRSNMMKASRNFSSRSQQLWLKRIDLTYSEKNYAVGF